MPPSRRPQDSFRALHDKLPLPPRPSDASVPREPISVFGWPITPAVCVLCCPAVRQRRLAASRDEYWWIARCGLPGLPTCDCRSVENSCRDVDGDAGNRFRRFTVELASLEIIVSDGSNILLKCGNEERCPSGPDKEFSHYNYTRNVKGTLENHYSNNIFYFVFFFNENKTVSTFRLLNRLQDNFFIT